jgi:hypothetical protein
MSVKKAKFRVLMSQGDDSQSLDAKENIPSPATSIQHPPPRFNSRGDLVWCQWQDGCYYPASVVGFVGRKVRVSWLEGHSETAVSADQVVPFTVDIGDTVMAFRNGVYQSVVAVGVRGDQYLVASLPIDGSKDDIWWCRRDELCLSVRDRQRQVTKQQMLKQNTERVEPIAAPAPAVLPVVTANLSTTKHLFDGYELLLTTLQSAQESNKKHAKDTVSELKSKLTASGATILEVDDILEPSRAKRSPRTRVLIASKTCRTVKYFLALADGMPRISVEWLHICFQQQRVVDYSPFLLPNGSSPGCGDLVPHLINVDILKSCCLFLHGVPPLEREAWNKVIRLSGGKLAQKKNSPQIDYVVTFHGDGNTDDVDDALVQLKRPVLKKEWLCASLITQSLCDIESFRIGANDLSLAPIGKGRTVLSRRRRKK